jgi:hypothetical protein
MYTRPPLLAQSQTNAPTQVAFHHVGPQQQMTAILALRKIVKDRANALTKMTASSSNPDCLANCGCATYAEYINCALTSCWNKVRHLPLIDHSSTAQLDVTKLIMNPGRFIHVNT